MMNKENAVGLGIGLAVGLAIGLATGLLIAPKSGEDTRKWMAETTEQIKDKAKRATDELKK